MTGAAGSSAAGGALVGGAAGGGGASASGSAGQGMLEGGRAGGGAGGGGAATLDCGPAAPADITVEWEAIGKQPAAFYAGAEARVIADNVLYYQNADHGWPKNVDMTTRAAAKARSTIDNRGTTTQIDFLARVFGASRCAAYRDAALQGLQFLLDAQYENGGWPQVYPDPSGYQKHITFNDDAMLHVLQVLRAVGSAMEPYSFVDQQLRATAASAVARGISAVLACQIRMADGQRGWCAQHDEVTLEPALARTYELPSVSGSEGAAIARFLMTIDPPTPEIREAVEGAIAWFEATKLTGIRVEKVIDASQTTGEDRVVVEDPSAGPLWARFYELGTNRPIFSSRCEVPECDADPFFMRRYSLAEIDNERRVGYAWYGNWPSAALSDYAAWRAKYGAP